VLDKQTGCVFIGILLPLLFAVGVCRHPVTLLFSVLAALCWLALGMWIQGTASC
jgi:hypothetical protein